jgi:hypothetical protein
MENYFIKLNNIDCSTKIEQKNGLSYLSWAWAWGEIKKIHPKANYKIYETETGINYWTDGRTGWVKTGVTIDDIEHIEYLPIMDFKNRSIPLESITSFDVNKAIQRSLTKACARHGLGLYIYAGEDLPESEKTKSKVPESLFIDVEACTDVEQLQDIWNKNVQLQKDAKFIQAVTNQKKKLNEQK